MDFLSLLAKGLEIITSFLPRPMLVPKTQRAVVWILGFAPRSLYGLLIIWPLVETVETADLREEATPFEPTVLWTKDGQEVSIGAVLTWAIADPRAAHGRVGDLTEWIGEKVESILPRIVGTYTLVELQRKAAGGEGREWALDRHLLVEAEKMLSPYGVKAISARVNFTARTKVYRVITGRGGPQTETL